MSNIIILGTYSIFLLTRSFKKISGFATWHMFTTSNYHFFHLIDQEENKINVWDYLSHTHMTMHVLEIEFFLKFLRDRSIIASGEIGVYLHGDFKKLKVDNGFLVD